MVLSSYGLMVQVSPRRIHGAAPAPAAGHYGEGARIYVGGVPDLVSVNMVRSHFSRWGTVRNPRLGAINPSIHQSRPS